MLDVATDITQACITFGMHTEILEVDELSDLRSDIQQGEISARVQVFRDHFDAQADCSESELNRAARTSVALDRFVERHDLQSLAYYYKGSGNEANEDTMSSIILGTSLLTARHIPVAGEYEVKNAIAMKIMVAFGAGGSFTEYYAIDFNDDIVMMGHDGPGHTAIAQGKTKVRPLDVYHGKVGRGLSVEMSVRYGPVTVLSIAEDREHGFKLLVAQGQCEDGPTLAIGNTNSRYRFPIGARGFVEKWNEQGPAHHCAVGVGHIAGRLEKLAKLLDLPFVQIC
jgi:L-arabinose isomerase